MSFHLRTIGSSDRIPAKLIRTSDSEVVNQHAFIPSKSGSSFIFVFACNSCSCLSCAAQGLVYESLSSVHKPPTQLKRPFEPNGAQNIGAWAQGSRAAGDRSGRVTEIQQALIREHYLTGDATGKWDATTQAAMQKYQADQGWQTKLMPDSRALKKLGLGADYSSAINAKTASFADPAPISSVPAQQTAGFAAASGTDR